MKVNLLNNSHETYPDFDINLDPYAQQGDGKIKGNLANLDEHVENGEATFILSKFILEFMDSNTMKLAMDNWVRKLAFGGKLHLTGYDSKALAREYTLGGVDEVEFNRMLYGDNSTPWNKKSQILSLKIILNELQNRGLTIEKACVQNLQYNVIGVRSATGTN